MSAQITLTRRRELALLATLAAIQFTHIVDFMIMMPLAPQLMRLWGIGPQAFGLLLSAYTFGAAVSGLCEVLVVGRYDRAQAMLFVCAPSPPRFAASRPATRRCSARASWPAHSAASPAR